MYLTCGTSTGFCTSEPQALVVATEYGRPEHGWNNTSGNGPFLLDLNGHVYHSIETLELTIIGTCEPQRVVELAVSYRWTRPCARVFLHRPNLKSMKARACWSDKKKERNFVEGKYVTKFIAMSVSRLEADREKTACMDRVCL